MANPVGTEIVQVAPVQSNGQPAATFSYFTLNQLGLGPSLFGGGTGTIKESGNLSSQVGNPLSNPASITNDNVLAVYSLPASSLNASGVGIEVTASGNFAADSQAKRVKLIWNPTAAVVGSAVATNSTSFLLGDTGSTTNAGALAGWVLQAEVYKYGVAGSNTQIGQFLDGSIAATNLGVGVASALTNNESGAILLAVTGNATTSVGDISLYNMNVEGFN